MASGDNQRYNITIGANMDPSGVLSAVKQMQGAFNGLKLPTNMTGDVLKNFNKLTESLSKFEKIASQDHFSKADIKALQKLQKEIDSTFGELKGSFSDLSGQKFYLEADYTKIKEARQAVEQLKADIQTKLSDIKIDFNSAKGGSASLGLDTLLGRMEQGVKTSKTLSSAMSEIGNSIRTGNLGAASEQFTQMMTKAKGLKGASAELLDTFKQWGLVDFSGSAKQISSMEERGRLLQQVFEKLVPIFSQDGEAIEKLSVELKNTVNGVAELEKIGAENYTNAMEAATDQTAELGQVAKQTGEATTEMADGMRRASDEVKQLQQSTQYFFSLRNMINLLMRGLREAVDVVKELDAAMTKTAVVTNFSVGDMWEKLPQYTANANALGASVKDMYEATTLYYQQGLNSEQAMGIANETMKMARIGGLEAADATDKMTAALRGFNMELNETSAQRVNDVYSNLAAKTASNTEELGTAMQRTASIAASAGMSFEGTAAFLAQAIETTREPAENLGTAMKTIVARFTELKKNPLEISEVDGEEVDYNKVDTALQSIGVSLKDANGQFRDLDKVFLDISQRWNSLTQTQQRYVATTAAGSRQQSRFIAMMSNYERTVQLMDFANNSAGASNEQFGKTMESLEAKLNKLKNAWNKFLMGIMNDSWTKTIVDGTTTAIDKINDLINILSGGGKLKGVKSFLSLFTAFMGLRFAGGLANFGIGKLGKIIDPTAKKGSLNLGGAKGIAGSITTPIVAKLNELIAVTKGQKASDKAISSTLAGYKNATNLLRTPQTMGTTHSTFGQLSDEHAYAAYINSPGTASAMKHTAMQWLDAKQLGPEMQKTGEQLMDSIFKGMERQQIPIKKGTKLIGRPELWGKYLGTETAKSFSENFITTQKKQQASQIKNAQQRAANMAWEAFGGSAYATDETKQNLYKTNAELRELYKNYYKQIRQQQKEALGGSLNTKAIDFKPYEQLANRVGTLGSSFTAAGYSMQMFGAQLGQLSPSLANVGNLITRLGATVSTFGMGFSGMGNIVTKVGARLTKGIEAARLVKYGNTIGGLINSGQVAKDGMIAAAGAKAAAASGAQVAGGFATGFLRGIPTPLLAAAGVAMVLGIFSAIQKHAEKKAQEAGEKVRNSFEENFVKADEKITSLEDYKTRFDELSKGVDEFGHNVNLSAEEYDEYLNISKELQQLSPSLIAGYDAEGNAIIKKGEAIQEVINKLKEEKQAELELFTSNTSVDKLMGEYKTSDTYKQYHNSDANPVGVKLGAFKDQKNNIAALNDSSLNFNLTDAVNQLTGWNLDSLSNLNTEQLNWLSKHYNDVINLVEEKNGQLDEKVKQGYIDAFTDAGSAINDVMTEGQPIIDAMQQWMGLEGIDAVGLGIGEEFADSFNQGFEGIMLTGLSEGWTADEFKTNLTSYSKEWKNLAGSTSEYASIMEDAKNVQDDFLDNMGSDSAVQDYNKDITDSCNKLIELANNTDTATEAGRAFQQQCIAQANALRNYATEGGESLSEALNTATDDIAQAESALENFNEATKTDLYTAAEGMKSIYDKAFETYTDSFGGEYEKHFEGKGDRTAWEAGRSILSEDVLKSIESIESIPDGQALRSKLKEWEPALREGEEGWYNFWNKITGDSKLMEKLNAIDGVHWDEDDFYIPEDKWAEVAKEIGISEEMLTSMLNKGRQFADISFTNWKQTRHSLETSNVGIQGTESTVSNGQRKLFIKEETFEAALADANYKPEEYEGKKQEGREQQNLEYLKAASEYNSKELRSIFEKDMGINNLNDLISSLYSTGDYNKEEIEAYAKQAGFEGDFDTTYDRIAEAIDNPELYKQTSVLEKISGQIAALSDESTTADQALTERDDFASALYGTLGKIDSAADYFAHGQDTDGKKLTLEEYEATKQSYEAQKAWAEQQAAIAKGRADNASTPEEQAKWLEVAEKYSQDAANIGTYLAMAAAAFESSEEEKSSLTQQITEQAQALAQSNASDEEIKASMTEAANKMAEAQMKPEDIAAALNKAYGTNLEGKDVNIGKDNKVDLNVDDEKLNEQLSNLHADVTANITDIRMGGGLASGQNNPNSIFHHGTMARGSHKGYTISGRPTLTGEEGEELVWEPKRNQAYMVGSNGPQFANISKDAVVWNAEQTKRIKKNSKVGSFGTGAKGISRFGTMAGGSGGLKIPGILDVDATANIQEVVPPQEEPTIPVKANLEIENGGNGSLASKIFGGGTNNSPSIDVAANITKLNNTTSVNNIDATATVTEVRKASVIAGEPISVKATATATSVKNDTPAPAQKAPATSQTMKVNADTSAAQSKINQLISLFNKTYTLKYKASGPSSIKVPISANFTGSWKKTVEITKGSGARGINNYIGHYFTPAFNSAAKGYGQLGPKGKGGLTLTGEKGFEIAWLPSENRSMILGANGPQMLNLPSDTVVYTHEQSKKILKQKSIPAGSHSAESRGSYDADESRYAKTGQASSASKQTAKNNKDTAKNNKKAAEVIDKMGRVSVWWENMTRRVDATQRNVDKSLSKFEKIIQGGGKSSTRANADTLSKEYAANLNKIIALSNQEVAKAQQELNTLNNGAGARNQKGKKKLYEAGAENIVQISYSAKKGKSKQKYVDLAQYITAQDGTLVVDPNALRRISDVNERQAVADAANKEINERLQKLRSAEDAIAKAQEALEKMANDVYEAFDQWDKTITQVYLLGQRLEQLTKQQNVYEAGFNSEVSRLTAGFGNALDSVERINSALAHSRDLMISQVDGQYKLIEGAFKEYQALTNLDTYYLKTIRTHPDSTKAKEDYEMMKVTLEFLKKIGITDMSNFDYSQAVQDIEQEKYTNTAYDKIKNGLDKIHDAQEAYYSSIEETYKLTGELYDTINEYQSFISEFEHNLLDGIEEQTKSEINRLDKLNSSLSKAYKELLDEVKKRLDERRKQEDNQKTEFDISRKQQRLAMLQADTSGGHQVEIAQLQKEIAEAQQNYQRTLEDQLLEKLQNQADEAEKQRQRQIELLEGQNEIASQLGTNLEEVRKLLENPEANYEAIRKLYYENQHYDDVTSGEQQKIAAQFEADIAKYLSYSEQLPYLKSLDANLLEILHKTDEQTGIVHLLQEKTQLQSQLQAAQQKALQEGTVSPETQSKINNLQERINAIETAIQDKIGISTDNLSSTQNTSGIKEAEVITTSSTEEADKAAQAATKTTANANTAIDKAAAERAARQAKINAYNSYLAARKKAKKISSAQINDLFTLGSAIGKGKATVLRDIVGGDGADPFTWKNTMKAILGASGINRWNLLKTFPNSTALQKALTSYLKKTLKQIKSGADWNNARPLAFSTGGLASYTGPAWLDGTPSKPELVLNARDTANFMALKDVLSKAVSSTNSIDNSYTGDNIFEININVDKIEKDYDVDRVIEKVKKEITKGAGYRNVTQVRNFR